MEFVSRVYRTARADGRRRTGAALIVAGFGYIKAVHVDSGITVDVERTHDHGVLACGGGFDLYVVHMNDCFISTVDCGIRGEFYVDGVAVFVVYAHFKTGILAHCVSGLDREAARFHDLAYFLFAGKFDTVYFERALLRAGLDRAVDYIHDGLGLSGSCGIVFRVISDVTHIVGRFDNEVQVFIGCDLEPILLFLVFVQNEIRRGIDCLELGFFSALDGNGFIAGYQRILYGKAAVVRIRGYGRGNGKAFARGNIRLNVKIFDNRRNGVDILVFERYRVGLGRVVTRFVSRTEVNGVRTGFALGGIAVAVFSVVLREIKREAVRQIEFDIFAVGVSAVALLRPAALFAVVGSVGKYVGELYDGAVVIGVGYTEQQIYKIVALVAFRPNVALVIHDRGNGERYFSAVIELVCLFAVAVYAHAPFFGNGVLCDFFEYRRYAVARSHGERAARGFFFAVVFGNVFDGVIAFSHGIEYHGFVVIEHCDGIVAIEVFLRIVAFDRLLITVAVLVYVDYANGLRIGTFNGDLDLDVLVEIVGRGRFGERDGTLYGNIAAYARNGERRAGNVLERILYVHGKRLAHVLAAAFAELRGVRKEHFAVSRAVDLVADRIRSFGIAGSDGYICSGILAKYLVFVVIINARIGKLDLSARFDIRGYIRALIVDAKEIFLVERYVYAEIVFCGRLGKSVAFEVRNGITTRLSSLNGVYIVCVKIGISAFLDLAVGRRYGNLDA